MKKLIVTVLLCIFFQCLKCQILSDTSIVYKSIRSFIMKGLKDTSSFVVPEIFHKNLLDSSQNEYGVFIFRPLTSIDKPKLYLRDFNCKNIEIVNDYILESVLPLIFKYFEKNKKVISYVQKLETTKRVIEVLLHRVR